MAARSKGLELWRLLGLSVTPKVHLLEDHYLEFAYDNADWLFGLRQFDEQFVERFHQHGKKADQWGKSSARNVEKKFDWYSRWVQAETHPDVVKELKRVAEARKRKRPHPDSESSSEERPSKKAKAAMDRAVSRQNGIDFDASQLSKDEISVDTIQRLLLKPPPKAAADSAVL